MCSRTQEKNKNKVGPVIWDTLYDLLLCCRYVGMEPSGRKFNDMELDHNHQPHNPIVNAGSILTLALVQRLVRPELSNAAKFDYILAYFTKMAGGETIGFNNSVFLAEREHADR